MSGLQIEEPKLQGVPLLDVNEDWTEDWHLGGMLACHAAMSSESQARFRTATGNVGCMAKRFV